MHLKHLSDWDNRALNLRMKEKKYIKTTLFLYQLPYVMKYLLSLKIWKVFHFLQIPFLKRALLYALHCYWRTCPFYISRSVQINLGNACRDMWSRAGNNLITPAGPNQELTVIIPAANPLFQVVAGGGGGAKIASLPFARFHGNVFWLLSLILFCLFYVLSHYSPFLSLIDEREQFSPNSSRSPFAIHIYILLDISLSIFYELCRILASP